MKNGRNSMRPRKAFSAFLGVLAAVFIAVGYVPADYVSLSGTGKAQILEDAGLVLTAEAKTQSKTKDYYATTGLNIRKSASADSKKLGSFAKGDKVKVASITDGWAKIVYKDATAYVSSKYLSKTKPEPAPAKSSSGSSGSGKASASVSNSWSSGADNGSGAGGGMVWISETGSKYHSINDCGRMNPNNAWQESESAAIAQGYEPCKKCW